MAREESDAVEEVIHFLNSQPTQTNTMNTNRILAILTMAFLFAATVNFSGDGGAIFNCNHNQKIMELIQSKSMFI